MAWRGKELFFRVSKMTIRVIHDIDIYQSV